MRRPLVFAIFIVLATTSSAWCKFKQDEEKYLSDQFRALQEQLHTVGSEVAALKAQVAELKQSQAQLQELATRQSRSLEEMEKTLGAERTATEESLVKLGKAVADARAATESSLNRLAPATAAAPLAPAPGAAPRSAEAPHGYVTNVDGGSVIIDIGSASGIQVGSQLAVYKASDRNTPVGAIQVLQVLDANTSKAQIVHLSSGAKLDFSDEVRLQ